MCPGGRANFKKRQKKKKTARTAGVTSDSFSDCSSTRTSSRKLREQGRRKERERAARGHGSLLSEGQKDFKKFSFVVSREIN